MTNLVKLNAILRVYNSNFLNLHWNCKGEEFDDAHKSITTGYYELCDKYIDVTAEMAARLGNNALNFMQIAIFFKKEDKYLMIDSSRLYDRSEIIKYSDTMLTDICELIKDCLEDSIMEDTTNAGIKSELETMLNEFDIECNYINKRRMCD